MKTRTQYQDAAKINKYKKYEWSKQFFVTVSIVYK